jgi:hypothetical protein
LQYLLLLIILNKIQALDGLLDERVVINVFCAFRGGRLIAFIFINNSIFIQALQVPESGFLAVGVAL